MTLMERWTNYRDTRRATFEFRARTRYKAVADRLFALGLNHNHVLLDLGAGECQFGLYLRTRGWGGLYMPVDAILDGTDLETFKTPFVDFITCIEVLEHLKDPHRLLVDMVCAARRGLIVTTPNCEAVDVLGCDPTHVSVISPEVLDSFLNVERHSWFGVPDDSLLAWRQYA